jgi:hypothetical protein
MSLTEQDKTAISGHYARLWDYAWRLFLFDQLKLDPAFTKVGLGFYASSKIVAAKDRTVAPFKDHADFKIKLKYMLLVDKTPLKVSASQEDGDYTVEPWEASFTHIPAPLLHQVMKADFSEDDEEELRRCGVKKSVANVFGNLSKETRQIYKSSLESIRDKPIALADMKSKAFIELLAGQGTYDTLFGIYYEKWQPDDGKTPRSFPGSLTANYIQKNIAEVQLAKGRDYLMITSDTSFELFEIADGNDTIQLVPVLGGHDTHHGSIDPKRQRTLLFFHSVHGEKETKQRKQSALMPQDIKPQRLILDPRGMVEAIIGKEGGKELEKELSDPFDWFVEMCIMYFPQEFYTCDWDDIGGSKVWKKSKSWKMLKQEMDASVRWIIEGNDKDFRSEALDPIRRAEIETVLAKDFLIMFPQALKFGDNTRLIACDLYWAYFADLQTGVVYTEKTTQFVENYRIQVIAKDVYESTRGVIPLVALVFAAAAAGVGAAAVATAGLGGALVKYAVREITVKELTSRAMKRLAKYMAPAIIAYTTKIVLVIWIYADDGDNKLAKRWKAFADGFFQGYLVNTIYDKFFQKLKDFKANGPKEYRMYKMIKTIYAALDKARVFVDKLDKELDEESIKKGIDNFERAMTHAVRGIALLFPGLYYAHHEDMNAVADGLSGQESIEPTDSDLFDLESSVQIGEIAKQLKPIVADTKSLLAALTNNTALTATIATVVIFRREVITGVIGLARLSGKGVAKAWDKRTEKMKELEKKVGGVLKNPTVWKILAGVAVATGVIHEIKTKGKGTKKVLDSAEQAAEMIAKGIEMLEPLFTELVSSWPGSTEDRARTHGELVGGMVGAIAFNRFLFGSGDERKAVKDKKWADSHNGEQWMKAYDTPFLGSFMKNNIKLGIVGPILTAIFRRYISLFKHIKDHGWPDAPQRTEEALGHLLSDLEDDALGAKFKRLSLFRPRTDEISFSIQELVKVIFRLRHIVGSDLKAYLDMRTKKGDVDLAKLLPEEFEAVIDAAKVWGMPDLVAKYGTQLYVVMATHLHLALGELSAAFEGLFSPFTKNDLSWMSLLQELGLDVGNLDAAIKQLNAAKRDGLKPFKPQ